MTTNGQIMLETIEKPSSMQSNTDTNNSSEKIATNGDQTAVEKSKSEELYTSPELEKYWKAVKDNPADFTGWTYLLQHVEQQVEYFFNVQLRCGCLIVRYFNQLLLT